MLKAFSKLYDFDIQPYVETRKDRDGEFAYLPWATCKRLLHEQGAERVRFIPLYTKDGHSLFVQEAGRDVIKDTVTKRAVEPMAPEVHVRIEIDSLTDEFSYPLINGKEVITMNKVNQQLVNTARQRAFVKGVAQMTGLGLKLWEKGDESEDKTVENLHAHSIRAIQKRVEQLITAKIQNGLDERDICAAIGISEKKLKQIMASFGDISLFEKKLAAL